MDIDKIDKMFEEMMKPENIEKFVKMIEKNREFENRWVERFKKYCENNIDETIEKIVKRYDDDEYRSREYKKGYQPREPLYGVVFDYAEKYCTPCDDEQYWTMFTSDAYYIGSYVVALLHGQGSCILFYKQNNK